MSFATARRWLCAATALLAAGPAAAEGRRAAPGDFDYYVLALSWSPNFCDADRDRRRTSPAQCAKAQGFIVHGLWPQWRAGGWPERCRADSEVPPAVKDRAMAITPDRRLIEHQWDRHGVCTAEDSAGYFALAAEARRRVAIPPILEGARQRLRIATPELERLFAEANPGLTPDAIAVVCRPNLEVRVCLDRRLDFTACGADVRDTCRTAVFKPGW